MAVLKESGIMNSVFWTIRNLLVDKSSNPLWYNGIQHVFGSHKMWSQFVQHYLPQKTPYQILDIGCGTATILNYLPENASYVGIDSHQPYIDACNRRFSHRGTFICSDWNINFTVPKVDVVLLLGLLHHLPDDDAKQVINLASDQLKSGGILITLDGCRESDRSSLEEFLYLKQMPLYPFFDLVLPNTLQESS